MRPVVVAFLALLSGPWASAADFLAPPPYPIAGFAAYEVFAGELSSPRLNAGYRFYVDPAHGALFKVMRYRLRAPSGGPAPTEKFVWNERPGQRVPLRCFERVEAAGGEVWRELDPAEAAFGREMATLTLVLMEQNRAYRRQLERTTGR
jgi:hypothetical protein